MAEVTKIEFWGKNFSLFSRNQNSFPDYCDNDMRGLEGR